MSLRPTSILFYGCDNIDACIVMAWWHTCMRPHVFVPYPLRKFILTLSFSYWRIWHLSVFTSCQVLSVDYVRVRLVHFFSFSLCIHAVEIFFVPFSFVSTGYPVLHPLVSTLDSIISTPVSMLDWIYSWFDLNLTSFSTRSLIEGGTFWRVSTCFHPIITAQKFANRDTCKALVKKSVRICSVLQYAMDILLISTLLLENN